MVLETILDIEFQDMVAGDKAIFYQAIVVITFPHPFSLCIINIILHPLTAFIHSLWSLHYYLWNNSINIDIEINQHQSISRTTGTLLTLCSSMDTSSPSPYLRWATMTKPMRIAQSRTSECLQVLVFCFVDLLATDFLLAAIVTYAVSKGLSIVRLLSRILNTSTNVEMQKFLISGLSLAGQTWQLRLWLTDASSFESLVRYKFLFPWTVCPTDDLSLIDCGLNITVAVV